MVPPGDLRGACSRRVGNNVASRVTRTPGREPRGGFNPPIRAVWVEAMKRIAASALGIMLTACFSTHSAKQKHADFHRCAADSVHAEAVEVDGREAVRTQGCGHDELFFCIGAKCRSPRMLAVRLFSAKHSCEQDEVQTSSVGNVWTLQGCGKEARYRCVPAPRDAVDCQDIE